jgi:gliding motility-associated-like protein
MKKLILSFSALVFIVNTHAQVTTAKDCTAAVNICTNNTFSVASGGGGGFTDFSTGAAFNVSNPTNNPAGVVPVGGGGCLKSGELNPTWMIINIQTPGTLEFSMGAGTGPGAQSGCYDWSMWPYTATTCAGINGNTLAPVRCCWNSFCSGGTGLASAANLPAGGHSADYGAPLNVNCGDKFILCFSNFSSVTTGVPLNFFGTANVSCSPVGGAITPNSATICPGASATLSVTPSPGTTYTWMPGGMTTSSISVSPSSTTVYTLNATNSCGVLTGTSMVYVSPVMTPTVTSTNGSCAASTLGSSTVVAGGGTGTISYTWAPVGGNASTTSGLSTGTYSVTLSDALGCKVTATTSLIAPAPISFSLNAPTGTTVFCNPNTLTVMAVNTSTLSNITYTWTTPSSSTLTGSSISITAPGTYTVFGQDLTIGSCSDTQFITISQNTTAPTVTVTPPSQALTCNGGPVSFTAVSTPTSNVFGQWFDAGNLPIGGLSGSPLLLSTSVPGVYTASFVSVFTGCTASETVNVTAPSAIPTMTVNAVNGYTVTCNFPSLQFNIQASLGPTPTSYSWTNISTNATSPSASGGYTITTPGNYVASYEDGNHCVISQTITVLIDTVKPTVTAITNLPSNSFTLNCYNPSLIATAVSNPVLPVTNYSWTQPPNGVVHSPTMQVNTTSVTASPTNFTVMAEGMNGCVGRQKIAFYEDLVVPSYGIVFTPTAITCSNPNVALTADHLSGPSTAAGFTFTSPAPTQTASTSGALFSTPGQYSLTVQLLSNGCYTSAVGTVPLNTTPPPIGPIPTATIPCGSNTVNISAGTLTTSTSYSYAWFGPSGAAIGQPDKNTTSVNMTGHYIVFVYNLINGCRSTNEVDVVPGSIAASFVPSVTEGFAPLSVNFDNTSYLGPTSSGTITTNWSYGNGMVNTYTNTSAFGSPDGSTTFQAAGSYTVLLVVTQNIGTSTCIGTATAVVNVDLPSDLTVPNVFTPNEDGINDLFQVQSTNLTEITCQIFDRWGVKMYDVTSDKGNIAWDGKTFGNKETPAGTYFYILKATGKDGTTFERHGALSLYR